MVDEPSNHLYIGSILLTTYSNAQIIYTKQGMPASGHIFTLHDLNQHKAYNTLISYSGIFDGYSEMNCSLDLERTTGLE